MALPPRAVIASDVVIICLESGRARLANPRRSFAIDEAYTSQRLASGKIANDRRTDHRSAGCLNTEHEYRRCRSPELSDAPSAFRCRGRAGGHAGYPGAHPRTEDA